MKTFEELRAKKLFYITQSNIIYNSDGKKCKHDEAGDGLVLIQTNKYAPLFSGYTLEKHKDYMIFRNYRVIGANGLTHFKTNKPKLDHIINLDKTGVNYWLYFNFASDLILYKDGTVLPIYLYQKDNKIYCCVIRKDYYYRSTRYDYATRTAANTIVFDNYSPYITWGCEPYGGNFDEFLKQKAKILTSEEEILSNPQKYKEYAFAASKMPRVYDAIEYGVNLDKYSRMYEAYDANHNDYKFDQEDNDAIAKMLLNSPYRDEQLARFSKKYYKDPESLMDYIKILNIEIKRMAKPATEGNMELLNNWKFNENALTWQRKDGIIAVTTWVTNHNNYYQIRNSKTILLYDVKKRTRTMFIKKGDEGWTKQPVVESTIVDRFKMDTNCIEGNADDIRKGTILEFALNAPDKITLGGGSKFYYSNYGSANIKASATGLDVYAIRILLSGVRPVMEMLAKSGLWNMYSLYMREPVAGTRLVDEKKWNTDGSSNSPLAIIYKGKNLKQMFKLTMPQLKAYDSYVEDAFNKNVSYSQIMGLAGIHEFAGDLQLNQLSLEQWKETIQIMRDDVYKGNRYGWKAWMYTKSADGHETNNMIDSETMNLIMGPLSNVPWLNKIKYWKEVSSSSEYTIKDYFRMRNQLIGLSQDPEQELNFNEAAFPTVFKPKTVFKHFRAAEYNRYGYGWGWNTPEERFSSTIAQYVTLDSSQTNYNTYTDAVKNCKDIDLIVDENGNLVGAMIKMDIHHTIKYLHDEISPIAALYRNQVNAKQFNAALDRVRPLEYVDEQRGLQIVAPKNAADVVNEGTALAHCVGSFVEPIAKGTENIMFIRRTDNPEEPYFTLALSPNRVIEQVHSWRNHQISEQSQKDVFASSGNPIYNETKDIVGFLRGWAKAKNINAASIKDNYGALCARR